MTLLADKFSYAGFTVGKISEGDDLQILVMEGGLAGLNQPPRTTTLSERQGHGRVPGAQWSNERLITAVMYTSDIDVVLRFDAAMASRPDPTDQLPWVGNFLGIGERLCWVRPEACEWVFDDSASIMMWKITAVWLAADATIYSGGDESDLSFGGGDPVPYADLEVVNLGLSTAEWAYSLRVQAHGTITDPYIQIQGDADRADESVRYTGLTMTGGQVLRIDRYGYAKVGDLNVDGKARSRGQKLITRPFLRPGTQTVRIGCISGEISGNFHHRSTWSV